MIGVIMDALLMLLLACALAYGVRLDKKLKALRDGQLAFAGAVNDLNMAAACSPTPACSRDRRWACCCTTAPSTTRRSWPR